MLSIAPVNMAQAMSSYYETEDYYARDDPAAKEASRWYGEGAKAMGLEGTVETQPWQRVIFGETPDGRLLGREVNGERQHRGGYDLTFSAPKSVSIMALACGDERLIKAHDDAVGKVAGYIERNLLQARIWDPNTESQVRRGNQQMVAAGFRHMTSRNDDPQLHTHAVVANMCRGEDGKWRSVSNEALLDNKMYLGLMYRMELARRVVDLGYEVINPKKGGLFEIAGVPQPLIDAFSSRRAEIEKALEGYDRSDARAAATAAVMTRKRKSLSPREKLTEAWNTMTGAFGFDGQDLIAASRAAEATKRTDGPEVPRDTPVSTEAQPPAEGAAQTDRDAAHADREASGTHIVNGTGSGGLQEPFKGAASVLQAAQVGSGPSPGAHMDTPAQAPSPVNGAGTAQADQEASGTPGGKTVASDGERQGTATPTGTGQARPDAPSGMVFDAVDFAIRHLSERETVFRRNDIARAALTHAINLLGDGGPVLDPLRIEGAIRHRLTDKTLIPSVHEQHKDGEWVTTLAALAREKETINIMKAARGTAKPLMNTAFVDRQLGKSVLNEGQRHAVRTVLTDQDRVIGIQGYAGVGKTTLLKTAREIAERKGYTLYGMAPSSSAVKTMRTETGIESGTLQGFLRSKAGYAEGRGTKDGLRAVQQDYRKTVLVLDEASLTDSGQMRNLLRIVQRIQPARLVLLGDEKQLDAVNAGRAFGQLQDHGLKTVRVGEIVRQKNEDLKAAVFSALAGDVLDAFTKLGDNIHEARPRGNMAPLDGRPERSSDGEGAHDRGQDRRDDVDQALADKTFEVWNAQASEIRDTTGIAAPTHRLRSLINARVQDQLLREGRLTGAPMTISTLRSEKLTEAEKSYRENYFRGDTVIFNRADTRAGVSEGMLATVYGRDRGSNSIALKAEDGRLFTMPLGDGSGVEVLRPDSLNIHTGDRVSFQRNDPRHGITNQETAEVAGIGKDGGVTFRRENGRTFTLGKDDTMLRFIDLNYATTVHSFQGRTVDNIIGVMHAGHPNLTTQKMFYVEISRARHGAALITDDVARLSETLEKQTGERLAALQALSPAVQAAKSLTPTHTERRHGDPGGNRRREPRGLVRGVDPSVDPRVEFAKALSDNGLVVEGAPVMDGQWHRVPVDGDKGGRRSGSYRGFTDGLPNGHIINYKTGDGTVRWQLAAEHMTAPLLPADARNARIEADERKRQAEAGLESARVATADRARERYEAGTIPSANHPYLMDKGVDAHGVRQDRLGRLLVPMRGGDGKIWNVQAIDGDGSKRFLKDGRKQGTFHLIGSPTTSSRPDQLVIVEGYATGASIHEATGVAVVVAFDAGNLRSVADTIRALHPDKAIIVAADNDHATRQNVGLTKGAEAARAVGGVMVEPGFTADEKARGATDFNDLVGQRGPAVIADIIEEALPRAFDEARAYAAGRTADEKAVSHPEQGDGSDTGRSVPPPSTEPVHERARERGQELGL